MSARSVFRLLPRSNGSSATLSRCILAPLAAILLLTGGHAAEAKLKITAFTLKGGGGLAGPIVVISEDGEKWTRIKDTEIFLEGSVRAKTTTSKIGDFGIYWGACSGNACLGEATPLMYSQQIGSKPKEINKYVMFDFATARIPGNGIAGFPKPPPAGWGYHIISKCNQALAAGGDIHHGHSFTFPVPVTLGVDTYVIGGGPVESGSPDTLFVLDDIDGSKTIMVDLPVTCEPVPEKVHIAVPLTPFEVTDAELFLATFKGDGPIPSQGASCKALKVTARFKTTTTGLVHFDLSRKVGDGPIATTPITIEAKAKPDGSHAAEYVNDWFFDKPTHAQFFVQETDGLGVSAGWKEIQVNCSGALADPGSQPPSDEPALRVLKSSFAVTTFAGDSPRGCPVNAALDVEFITNKPGGVPFKVTGSDGFVWNFSIKADEPAGPLQIGEDQANYGETYRAKYRRMIEVTKSTDAMYSLEVRNVAVEPDAKTAGPDNLEVRCGGDFTVPFAVSATEFAIVGLPGCPTTAFASATFVANAAGNVRYRLAATTGEVATGSVATKKLAGRFVAKVVMPVKITHGGEVVFSAIPLDFAKKLALAKKQYNCGGPRPGELTGGRVPKAHVDPRRVVVTEPRVIDPPRSELPKKKIVPVIVTPKGPSCAGGTIRSGRCVCPAGLKLVSAGQNAFRCVQAAPLVLTAPRTAAPKTGPKLLLPKLPGFRLR